MMVRSEPQSGVSVANRNVYGAYVRGAFVGAVSVWRKGELIHARRMSARNHWAVLPFTRQKKAVPFS